MVSAQIIAFTKQEAVLSDLPDKLHEEAQGFTSMIADLEEIPKKKKKNWKDLKDAKVEISTLLENVCMLEVKLTNVLKIYRFASVLETHLQVNEYNLVKGQPIM